MTITPTMIRRTARMPAAIAMTTGNDKPNKSPSFEALGATVVVDAGVPSAAAETVTNEILDASTVAGAFALKMGSVCFNQEESVPDWRLNRGASLFTAGFKEFCAISKRATI